MFPFNKSVFTKHIAVKPVMEVFFFLSFFLFLRTKAVGLKTAHSNLVMSTMQIPLHLLEVLVRTGHSCAFIMEKPPRVHSPRVLFRIQPGTERTPPNLSSRFLPPPPQEEGGFFFLRAKSVSVDTVHVWSKPLATAPIGCVTSREGREVGGIKASQRARRVT